MKPDEPDQTALASDSPSDAGPNDSPFDLPELEEIDTPLFPWGKNGRDR